MLPKTALWGAAIFGLLTISLFGVIYILSHNLPSLEEISVRQVAESTKIYARDGKTLLYETGGAGRRTVIPFEEIPKWLKDATVAIEDERFYSEPAFSWRGILRALVVNILHGDIVQGGSTITQQLSRNAFLSSERTLARKLREFILAIQLSRRYSKKQILEAYLNEIPYGPTLYGVETASRAYFNKSARDLNLAESAILAALPNAPSYYSPWGSHVKELLERQKLILKKMKALKMISDKEFETALATEVKFMPQNSQGIRAPHFALAVYDYLVDRFGEEFVRTGGLRVITTLDWNLQEIAERVVAQGAAENERLYQGKNAALLAQDAKTGEILAMVGSRNYFDTENDGNFNVATQGLRQPGSALKPFVYLAAFEKGYPPDTIVFDVPTEFSVRKECPAIPNLADEDKRCFHPENFDGLFRGPVTFRRALAESINVPAVKVLYLAGLQDVLKILHSAGITTLNDYNRYGLSLVLGGGEVKLSDLVQAYAVLAQEGIKIKQVLVKEIRDSKGRVLEALKAEEGNRVFDAQSARLVNNILSDIQARSGLFHGSLPLTVFDDHDVALKTGTSNDYRDAWAIGYTPSLVVGVWAGNNNNAPMQKKGSSILAAVPIWSAFMREALKNAPSEAFARPEPVRSEKPMLSGKYDIENNLHSILYYVERDNPNGPIPSLPEKDPQFNNWESAVLAWARVNIPNFSSAYNKNPVSYNPGSVPAQGDLRPRVEIYEPQNGSFVGGTITLRASIFSESELDAVRAYWNDVLVLDQQDAGKPPRFDINVNFSPQNSNLQNLLRIEAVTKSGVKGVREIILYK